MLSWLFAVGLNRIIESFDTISRESLPEMSAPPAKDARGVSEANLGDARK